MGSSESRRARLIGDGPGRLRGSRSIGIVRVKKNNAGRTERQLALALCLQGPGEMELGDRERAIRNEAHLAARLPRTVGILLGTIGIRFHWR